MSLPGCAIEQLRESRVESAEQKRIRELEDAIERQKETIQSLELANETLRRRVVSLEADRVVTA